MPVQVTSAELRAFKPGASTPFVTLSDALAAVDITETAQDAQDSGSITIDNTDDVVGGNSRITSGDRLEMYVQFADEATPRRWWTAIARDVSDEVIPAAGVQRVEIEATDFVFTVLAFRVGDGSFEGVDAGTVVDTLVADDAPEVGRSQIETIGQDVELNVSGRKLLDVISQDLAPRSDAVVAADGTDLVFRRLRDVGVKHDIRPTDLGAPLQVTRVDDELINRVRIDGGEAHAVDDKQVTQSSTARVTDSTRLTHQIQTRKSEVARIQLYTIPEPDSTDNLVVRLQAARGGDAVDIEDRESDLARRSLAPEFLEEDGYTEFLLPDHTLSPDEEPYLIVESGPTGHDVGTNGSGVPAYKAEFPYPLLARAEAGASQSEYRRRDLRRRDDTLQTEAGVEQAATAALRHRSEPHRRIAATAQSTRAHRLRPSDVVRVIDVPVADIGGTYLVTERSMTLEGTMLTTELTLEDTATV